jgi:hypothetical protein
MAGVTYRLVDVGRESGRIVSEANNSNLPVGFSRFHDKRNFLALSRLCWPHFDVQLWLSDAQHAIWATVVECDLTVRLSPAKSLSLRGAQQPCSAGRCCSRRNGLQRSNARAVSGKRFPLAQAFRARPQCCRISDTSRARRGPFGKRRKNTGMESHFSVPGGRAPCIPRGMVNGSWH